jgi:hypothetical protein
MGVKWFRFVLALLSAGVLLVADKTGLGRGGRLLLGHAQQVWHGLPGAADGSLPGQHLRCGSRLVGQAAPGEVALAAQVGVDLAGCVALEAADDLLL